MKLTACDEQDVNEIVDDRRCAKGTKQSLIAQAGKTDMKSELSATTQSIKNLAAFTLAEILLSLTVIGIVAAIALPSLLGNANERAWETQKKALYTRFSQSLPLLPSLNGYGELVGNLSNCADTNSCHSENELKDTAAESFIRDGLSKVMKITNICDNDHLSDCGLPDKIISLNGNTSLELSNIKILSKLNSLLVKSKDINYPQYEIVDTKAAAFETVNGESILVYYNPNCQPNLYETSYYLQTKMCANFIYDLNGKKGPNTVGKDIGFITAMYSTEPVILAPNPILNQPTDKFGFDDAITKCRQDYENAKLPNIEESSSLFVNKSLIGYSSEQHYSSDKYSAKNNYVWTNSGSGVNYVHPKTGVSRVIYCIKR